MGTDVAMLPVESTHTDFNAPLVVLAPLSLAMALETIKRCVAAPLLLLLLLSLRQPMVCFSRVFS
jgi:hypothetical protein